MGVREFRCSGSAPASVASREVLFWFGDLGRVVCSSIGHPDRGFEGLKVARHPASVASGQQMFLFGDLERGVCSSIGRRDRGFEGLKVARLLPRWGIR